MERVAFVLRIKDGMEQEYDRRHAQVWPELEHDLRTAGWRNYSLFRRDSSVFAYAECVPDAATAFAEMDDSAANARWAQWFGDVLEEHVGPDGSLVRLAEVWHLEPESSGEWPAT